MVNISIKSIERQYELYKKRMNYRVLASFREFKKAIQEAEEIESKRKE